MILTQGKAPPPKKKAKNGKASGVISETPASSTSPGSTRPPSPQARNLSSIASTARDVPPHMNVRPSPWTVEGEEDSDCEDIYVPFSNMEIGDINDLPPEEMEHAHVYTWERGDMEPETSGAPTEGQLYENLWRFEEDPRAVPRPELLCPTHQIACNKGICQDMSKMIKDKKKEEERAKWEEKKKNNNNKGIRFLSFSSYYHYLLTNCPHSNYQILEQGEKGREMTLRVRGVVSTTTMKIAKQPRLMETISLSLVLKVADDVLGKRKSPPKMVTHLKHRILDA